MSNYEMFKRIQDDPSIHYWVKNLLKEIDTKDPVDVLNNLDLLTSYFKEKLEISNKAYWIIKD